MKIIVILCAVLPVCTIAGKILKISAKLNVGNNGSQVRAKKSILKGKEWETASSQVSGTTHQGQQDTEQSD